MFHDFLFRSSTASNYTCLTIKLALGPKKIMLSEQFKWLVDDTLSLKENTSDFFVNN